jgi:hypothetical protein
MIECFAILLIPNHFDVLDINSDEEISSDVDSGIRL